MLLPTRATGVSRSPRACLCSPNTQKNMPVLQAICRLKLSLTLLPLLVAFRGWGLMEPPPGLSFCKGAAKYIFYVYQSDSSELALQVDTICLSYDVKWCHLTRHLGSTLLDFNIFLKCHEITGIKTKSSQNTCKMYKFVNSGLETNFSAC